MSEHRIPLYTEQVLINVDMSPDAADAKPIRYRPVGFELTARDAIRFSEAPASLDRQSGWDAATNAEVLRLMRERTCAYCRSPMRSLSGVEGYALLCAQCGYWGGRGQRHGGPYNRIAPGEADENRYRKGTLGRVRYVDLDSAEVQTKHLIEYLRRVPDAMFELSPLKAERFVMDLLREALECEVRPVGGSNDGGVDGFIVAGDAIKTIVQVKWHRARRRSEGVRLVREIAGTLVARGVPHGLLVTTSERVSAAGQREIAEIGGREILGIGPMRLDVRTYNDVIDMLELASAKTNADFESLVAPLHRGDRILMFDPFR